jgi:hypothetical protein
MTIRRVNAIDKSFFKKILIIFLSIQGKAFKYVPIAGNFRENLLPEEVVTAVPP